MKLNMGCGAKIMPNEDGWLNVDIAPGDGVDIVADITLPLPIEAGSVEEIYAKHVIEHIPRSQWPATLAAWASLLAPGGRLVIEAPDMVRLSQCIASNLFDRRWMWELFLFGTDGPGMRHHRGITIPALRSDLEAAGLVVTRARPWHDDDPDHVKDPLWHFNLRVEAVKP